MQTTKETASILTDKARYVRSQVLEMCVRTKSGHIASSLSCVDILVALYYTVLRPEDKFILSKGHAAPALYPILADLGKFPASELDRFCQGGMLGAHADPTIPGVQVVSGSLGHGLGLGAGLALAAMMDGSDCQTFVLMGDGECYEGSVWEAAMFAAHRGLNNLTAIIDRNGMCVTEYTESGLRLEPLADKWAAFGWEVVNVDGHISHEIIDAFAVHSDKPKVIIARTVKGKGVSCMENQPGCHTMIPRAEDLKEARAEVGQ